MADLTAAAAPRVPICDTETGFIAEPTGMYSTETADRNTISVNSHLRLRLQKRKNSGCFSPGSCLPFSV